MLNTFFDYQNPIILLICRLELRDPAALGAWLIDIYIYTRIYSPWWQAFNNRGWFIDKVIITIQKCQEGTKEGKRQKGRTLARGLSSIVSQFVCFSTGSSPSLPLSLSLSLSPFPLLSPSLSVLIKPKDDLIAKNVNNNIKNTTEAAARRRQNNLRPNRTRNNLLFFPFF